LNIIFEYYARSTMRAQYCDSTTDQSEVSIVYHVQWLVDSIIISDSHCVRYSRAGFSCRHWRFDTERWLGKVLFLL